MHHRDLHSFPTRRSSDLRTEAVSTVVVPEVVRVVPAATFKEPASMVPLRLVAATEVSVELPEEVIAPVALRLLPASAVSRSEEHTSELQSQSNLVCRLLL